MSTSMAAASILNEQVERFFAGTIDRRVLRSSEEGVFPTALWGALTELGLTTALVAEGAGGAGLGWPDVAGVFEALG